MAKSPKLGLMVTADTEDPKFKVWRTELAGASSDSNMMIIDAAVGDIQEWKEEKDSTPFTWGMLKYGLNHDGG